MSSNAQRRFQQHLLQAQHRFDEQPKMPFLCVIGQYDFDELRQSNITAHVWAKLSDRVSQRIADEWDPFNTSCEHFDTLKGRIEQEELLKSTGEVWAKTPVEAEAEAAMDPLQRKSQTDYFQYCGCHCYRSLNELRGFWFA